MMMKRLTTVALAVAMLAAVPGVAVAQEGATVDRQAPARSADGTADERHAQWVATIKARALEAIDKRLGTISDLEAAIDRSETVAQVHADQLLGELREAQAGLESLAAQIRAAEDIETLRRLIPRIFEDFRIYAIVAPKVHLVLVSDAAGTVADRLGMAAGRLGEVLDRLEARGFDVTDAEALLAEMERLVASGAESAASVPGMVLDLTPADYPGSTETIRTAHSVLQAAGSHLREAGETAQEIVRFIKSLASDDTAG